MHTRSLPIVSPRHAAEVVFGILLGAVLAAAFFVATAAAAQAGDDFDVDNKDLETLAREITQGEDHVTASQLAKWLVEDQRGVTVLDIRSADDFAAGHVKTAMNVSLAQLLRRDGIRRLPKGHRVVLYANDTRRAAQAATVLRLVGINAYSLLGGYVHWARFVLDPSAQPADADAPDQATREAMARALKQCPPLPVAEIPPLGAAPPAAAAPAPAAVPQEGAPAGEQPDYPMVIESQCG